MGTATAATTPRPRRLATRGQAGHVRPAVGGRRGSWHHCPRHGIESRCDHRHPRRWRKRRLRSLSDKPRSGRPVRATGQFRRELREALRKSPLSFGCTGRKIVLVLDRGNPNHSRALHRDLEMAKPLIEVFWLPNYCWNLNLIERVWKHLKASRIANVLFRNHRQFLEHVEAALAEFAKHPDLSFSTVTRHEQSNIRKNLVAHT